MDFTAIVTALGPSLVPFLGNFAQSMKTTTAPAPAPAVVPAGTSPHPDAAIKDLQTLLNNPTLGLNISPPLKVDGWLGPKTDAAIESAIAKLKAAGIG